jgi:hypothetical protein
MPDEEAGNMHNAFEGQVDKWVILLSKVPTKAGLSEPSL